MIMLEDTKSKDTAVQAVLDELRSVDEALTIQEEKVVELKRQRDHLIEAVSSLAELFTGEKKKDIFDRLNIKPKSPVKATRAGEFLIQKMKTNPEKEWNELQSFVEKKGEKVSDKYASNTMRKWHEAGHVHRVGRGVYRVNDTIFSMMGLDKKDYEE